MVRAPKVSGGVMRRPGVFFRSHQMAMSTQRASNYARASPVGDACRPLPDSMRNWQGLPAQGWGTLKKLLNKKIRLATLNIGMLTGHSHKLADVRGHCMYSGDKMEGGQSQGHP